MLVLAPSSRHVELAAAAICDIGMRKSDRRFLYSDIALLGERNIISVFKCVRRCLCILSNSIYILYRYV